MPQPRRPLVPAVVDRPALDLPVPVLPEGLVPPGGAAVGLPVPSDAQIWRRIVTPGSDVLFGVPFDRAVRDAPILVEAVVLQHVYGALLASRAPVSLENAEMAWTARNDLVRRVHGGLRPMEIATSQELNWAQWGASWEMYFRATGRTQSFVDATMALQTGFQAACTVATAAAQRAGSLEDREGWERLAACVQLQAEFLANLIFAPVRRDPAAGPAEPWPEAPPARRAAPRRLGAGPAALPGPVQVPEVRAARQATPVSAATLCGGCGNPRRTHVRGDLECPDGGGRFVPATGPFTSPRRELLAWEDGAVLCVEPAGPGRFRLVIVQDGAPLAQAEVEPATRSVHGVTGEHALSLWRLRMACLQMAGFNRVSRAANMVWNAPAETMDVRPREAQAAAEALGPMATDRIVGRGGLSGASAQAMAQLIQAGLVPADEIRVPPSAWFAP